MIFVIHLWFSVNVVVMVCDLESFSIVFITPKTE